MTRDEIIDWLHALSCQHGHKQVNLDGKCFFTDTIIGEAIRELDTDPDELVTVKGAKWRRLRDGSKQCPVCKGVIYEVKKFCPICGTQIGGSR